MKIRLDENVSHRVADALLAYLANRTGFEVSHCTYSNPGDSDPSWLRGFAADDGDVIISGDAQILQHWPDLVAYTESGLISFFPPTAFGKMKGYSRAAFILLWWPAMIEKAKISQRGDRWRLPMSWTPDHTKIETIDDPRLRTDAQKRNIGIEPAAKSRPLGRRPN